MTPAEVIAKLRALMAAEIPGARLAERIDRLEAIVGLVLDAADVEPAADNGDKPADPAPQ